MLEKITQEEIESNSMKNVSTTPSRRTPFGEGGFGAEGLKLRFDRLPRLIAKKVNDIIDAAFNGDLANSTVVQVGNDKTPNYINLGEFIKMLHAGNMDSININTPYGIVGMVDLAMKITEIYNGIYTGDLADQVIMKDGESFSEFYRMAKSFVESDREAIADIVVSRFTDVSEEGM